MSRMRSTPIGLAQRIDGWREEGRRAERERILGWLDRVGESLNEEPVCLCLPYAAGGDGPERDCPVHGEDAFTAELRGLMAEALYWHMTEADEARGCALRCGYDGPDRAEHLAAELLPVVSAWTEQGIIAVLIEKLKES